MAQRLGKYEIIEEIGRGGFATVYRARDPDLDREVALKVLDPALMRDPSLVERFRREARAAARLRHPGIVTIHEIGQAEGMLFIAMELLPGPSLKTIIESEAPLPVERAVELLRPLAEALDYAHTHGLVHRDVKPANVLLDERETPKLMDFGLVRAAEESGSSAVSLTLSQTGMTLGTPAYMAPEQADPEAKSPADRRADLYSLGVVAYEMLTGRVPFEGTTPLAVAMAHLIKAPPPPRELNPALPGGAEAAVLKILAKKPEDRFASAGAFVAALAASTVRPETAPSRAEGVQRAPTPSRIEEPPPSAAERRKERGHLQKQMEGDAQDRGRPRWLWPVLAALAALMVLGGVWATKRSWEELFARPTPTGAAYVTPGPATAVPTQTAPVPTAEKPTGAAHVTLGPATAVSTQTGPVLTVETPTGTPAPLPSDTSTPTPSATRGAPTSTATRKPSPMKTRTPTATPRSCSAPVLLEPPGGTEIAHIPITLRWSWDCTLGPDEYFRVTLRGGPASKDPECNVGWSNGDVWARDSFRQIGDAEFDFCSGCSTWVGDHWKFHRVCRIGPYYWTVQVVKGHLDNGALIIEETLASSTEGHFTWIGP